MQFTVCLGLIFAPDYLNCACLLQLKKEKHMFGMLMFSNVNCNTVQSVYITAVKSKAFILHIRSCTQPTAPLFPFSPFSPSQFLANTCRFSVSMSPTTWDTPLDWDQTAFASGDWLVSPSLLSLWFVHQQGVSVFLCWLRLDLVLRTWIRHHLLSRSLLGFWAASISWLLRIALLEGGDVHLPSRAFQFLWRRSEVSGLGPVVVEVLAVCRAAPAPFP